MNPYQKFFDYLDCSSAQEFYSKLELISKNEMGLDKVPFPLSALEHPPANKMWPEILSFINECAKASGGDISVADVINFIKFLKENPPEESYENPKLSENQLENNEILLITHIFFDGIELPGSRHNPFGHLQYFSSFFIDMFFGNYTEFNDYLKTLSKDELGIALKKREGYCQSSPLFAPILGLRMVDIERRRALFTSQQVEEIRTMYTGCNENKHLKILTKLIKLGADVNAHDINGFTPLHYAVLYGNEEMIAELLNKGANPNPESRIGSRPLTPLINAYLESSMKIIDVLIQHNARLTDNKAINTLRTSVEAHGCKELAVRVREAHPRDKEECEKCMKPAPKKCGACGKVYYCTPACQKLDWKFHKITCKKKE